MSPWTTPASWICLYRCRTSSLQTQGKHVEAGGYSPNLPLTGIEILEAIHAEARIFHEHQPVAHGRS